MRESRMDQETGRDGAGRFLPGRSGNPGGRPAKIATWRGAIDGAVGDADIAAVMRAMVEAAKGGDVAAARLLLAYTLGTPTTTLDLGVGQVDYFKTIDKEAADMV